MTVTNLAIPDIAGDFPSSLSTLSWVATAYTLLFAAALAPAGRLADVLGRRRLYVVGMVVFTAASLVAAGSPSIGVLLCARAVQGLGAAGLMPASLAFVLMDTPPARRLAAIGVWSAAASVAAAVGPALGGVLVDWAGWRWLFVINVPIGAYLAWRAARLPAGPPAPSAARAPDAVGAVALLGGLGALTLGLAEAQQWGWVSAGELACLIGTAVGTATALRRSYRRPNGVIEVGLWRSRAYAGANLLSLVFGAVLYALLLAGVLLLVSVWGYSELRAGLAMTPGAAVAAAVGLTLGKLKRKPSSTILTAVGAAAIALSGVLVAALVSHTPRFFELWLPCGVVLGAGIGCVSVGLSSAAALSVPPASFASATGLNIAARQIGGAIGLAVLSTCLQTAHSSADLGPYVAIYWLATAASVAVLAGSALLRPHAVAESTANRSTSPSVTRATTSRSDVAGS